jgi:hypothetical protein
MKKSKQDSNQKWIKKDNIEDLNKPSYVNNFDACNFIDLG